MLPIKQIGGIRKIIFNTWTLKASDILNNFAF